MNKFKMKKIISLFLFLSIIAVGSHSIDGYANNNWNTNYKNNSNFYNKGTQNNVMMAVIPEFQEKPVINVSIQPIPLHTAELLNYFYRDEKVTAFDIIKYFHPNFTTEEINNTAGTFDESLSYITSKGLKYNKVSGFPTWKIIFDELNAQRPVLVHLKANSSYWLEPETAVLIWGIQVFEFEGQPTNVIYFTRSLNHADNPIYSGSENNFDLLTNESLHDPTLQVRYSWVSTVYGFQK